MEVKKEGRPKILLVDDEPYNLDYLEQELEDLGVEILKAGNGQQALDSIAADPPDMVFLDIMMPGMNGFEVLQRLKAEPEWNSIPVVIISAASDMASVVKGIELGAEDYLPKPFNPVLMHARMNAGLEKKRLRDIEQRYLNSLKNELEIGRAIQAGFLPTQIPQPAGWQLEAYFCPARQVGGDFYDVFELEDGKLAILLGDVTDKGVGAALYMALFRSLLRAVMTMATCLDEITLTTTIDPAVRLRHAVRMVNDYLCNVHENAMFATLFFGALDLQNGELDYLNAGHDPPYILRGGAIHQQLDSTGPLVGAFPGVHFQTARMKLEPGDSLVLYTDGVTDAENSESQLFGVEKWQELLEEPLPADSKRLKHLVERLEAYMGETPRYDDITLLVVERL